MSLSPGERLGPYEVLGPIGAGGMGEVYRARDTRLDRTVALKVLPSELAADPKLKARFEREARAISALAHPNICTLHDVGEQDGQTFLVMEHLVGETLAERLEKGALPLAQALEIATQIADALSAAHKQDIVHRDLKPGNVMLSKTGAKLLDFGLARLVAHGEQPAVESLTSAPTKQAPLTGEGTILGTLPYMAPEQVEGKPADARTDLWALGTILYEMVSGHRAFEASSPASLIGAILEREPAPLAERQPLTPPSLERLVRRCLAKEPDDRWDTAHDVADELRWVTETAAAPRPDEPSSPAAWQRRLRNGALLMLAGLLLGAAGAWVLRPPTSPPPVVRSLLDVRPAEEVNAGGVRSRLPALGSRTALAWTPNGGALVFVGRREGVQQLYVRELEQSDARSLPGTEGAQVPAVSPDGQWVAFWAAGAIRKVRLTGGPSAVIANDMPNPPVGMSWDSSGQLFLGHTDGSIWRVSPGGILEPVTKRLETELSHILPSLLPGEDALLFTVRKRVWTWGDEEVVAQVLATGERKVLLHDAADARCVPSGHIVFLRRGVLFAVAFDPARLEVRGEPVPLLDGVAQALVSGNSGSVTGAGHFDVAPNGALAYVAGRVLSYPEARPAAVDRQGRVSPLPTPPRSYASSVRLSPDGQRLALDIRSLTDRASWLYDFTRGTLTRLTPGGEARRPLWSPDGERVAFSWLDDGVERLAWQRSDGSEPPEVLAQDTGTLSSWSPDGGRFAIVKDSDIWIVTLEGSKATLRPLTRTPHAEGWPDFSPDGRWLAYAADDSGRFEVYVQPFQGPGPRIQVSVTGGASPAWNPSGRELFFLTAHDAAQPETRQMMVVDVRTHPTLRLGVPRKLFSFSTRELRLPCFPARCYDVSADGQRFFAIQEGEVPPPPSVTHIHLVQNWLEEVKARVPTGR
jgi:Tol biopolymer transport system component